MNKSGIGVGSASIILIFTVLCLAIFALLTYTSARADKALSDASVRMMERYYAADTLAEQILAMILASDETPSAVLDVDIYSEWDWAENAERVRFTCPVSDTRALYVEAAVYVDTYDILIWELRGTEDSVWDSGGGTPVWEGF